MFLPECRKPSGELKFARDHPTVRNREDEETGTESVKVLVWVQRVNPVEKFFVFALRENIPAHIFCSFGGQRPDVCMDGV